jgi:hypothetical protein
MGFKAHIPKNRTGRLTLIATSAGNYSKAIQQSRNSEKEGIYFLLQRQYCCKTKIIADSEKFRYKSEAFAGISGFSGAFIEGFSSFWCAALRSTCSRTLGGLRIKRMTVVYFFSSAACASALTACSGALSLASSATALTLATTPWFAVFTLVRQSMVLICHG